MKKGRKKKVVKTTVDGYEKKEFLTKGFFS